MTGETRTLSAERRAWEHTLRSFLDERAEQAAVVPEPPVARVAIVRRVRRRRHSKRPLAVS